MPWHLSHVERLQVVRSPVLAYGVHRACSSGLRLLFLCLLTFGAVVGNTPTDFERLVSCSWLRVFQELVRELGLLYVFVVYLSEKAFEGLSLTEYLLYRRSR